MKSQSERNRPTPLYVGIISLVLVITLVAAAVPGSSASAVKCKFKYTVVAGDTLAYVGFLYTVSWLKIAEANGIQPPYTITVGQVLCIPEGEEPSSSGTATGEVKKGSEPSLTAVPGYGSILVSVENFLPKTAYYVRLFPNNWSVAYKLGHFKTNKEGDFADFFNVPMFVPTSQDVIVCVKNATTDATSCVRVVNEYYQTWISYACPPKDGR